ncbi:hypothetical protein HanRHA438_Chr11g0524271 [Helianthus annuus]|nr:hypothetical protein HanIR_Chr11g0550531 [Helianthus annuus]KAJ0872487.1 hypothetical protein HanRHA438_Chr11g0524271 [Helianthus annuus]
MSRFGSRVCFGLTMMFGSSQLLVNGSGQWSYLSGQILGFKVQPVRVLGQNWSTDSHGSTMRILDRLGSRFVVQVNMRSNVFKRSTEPVWYSGHPTVNYRVKTESTQVNC